MKPVNGAARVAAAVVALSMTLSIVWSMAALGYPTSAPSSQVAAVALQEACAQLQR